MNRWPHQAEFLPRCLAAIASGQRRICVQSPTGMGKTVMMQDLARDYLERGLTAILYTNRTSLIEQTSRVMDAAGIRHGVISPDHDDEGHLPFQVGMVQTVHNRAMVRKTMKLHDADLAIFDEAHLQTGESALAIMEAHHAAGAAIVGFTATPIDLGAAYSTILCAGTASSGRACGALLLGSVFSPDEPDWKEFNAKRKGRKIGEEADSISAAEAKSAIMRPDVFGRVIRHYRELNPEGVPTILFAPDVAGSIAFAEQFTLAGIEAAHIDGENVWAKGRLYRSKREQRDSVLNAVRDGRCKVICNRFVLREGIDLPEIGHCILATVFGNLGSYLQSVGRVLRYHPSLAHRGVTIQDHGGCLDYSTEILTYRGWVGPDEIKDSDTVAAFDRFNGHIVWKPILHRHDRFLEDGEQMYEVAGRSVNIRVTGNHRFLFSKRVNDGDSKVWPNIFDFGRADDLSQSDWRLKIPVAGVQDAKGLDVTDDQLRFFGWFMTDGTMAGARQAVSITQADHQPQIEDLRACLRGCGFDFKEYRHQSSQFASKPATKFAIPKGTSRNQPRRGWWPLRMYLDKNLPILFDLIDERQFAVFLHAVHMGDGAKDRNEDSYRISTGNKTFADRLQSLAVRKGWKCNISTEDVHRANPIYILNMQKVTATTIHGWLASTADGQVKIVPSLTIPGVTRVWCVANELETLVTRRNGMVAIIGNSWWRFGSPNADRQWHLGCTNSMMLGLHADRMRATRPEAKPSRCPKCGMVQIWKSAVCRHCAFECQPGRKISRPVIQMDGSLREMTGDIFRPHRVCNRPNGPALWERIYYRSLTAKANKQCPRTFRMAAALFAQENYWAWPDRRWPFMPIHPLDWFRPVRDIPLDLLIPKE